MRSVCHENEVFDVEASFGGGADWLASPSEPSAEEPGLSPSCEELSWPGEGNVDPPLSLWPARPPSSRELDPAPVSGARVLSAASGALASLPFDEPQPAMSAGAESVSARSQTHGETGRTIRRREGFINHLDGVLSKGRTSPQRAPFCVFPWFGMRPSARLRPRCRTLSLRIADARS